MAQHLARQRRIQGVQGFLQHPPLGGIRQAEAGEGRPRPQPGEEWPARRRPPAQKPQAKNRPPVPPGGRRLCSGPRGTRRASSSAAASSRPAAAITAMRSAARNRRRAASPSAGGRRSSRRVQQQRQRKRRIHLALRRGDSRAGCARRRPRRPSAAAFGPCQAALMRLVKKPGQATVIRIPAGARAARHASPAGAQPGLAGGVAGRVHRAAEGRHRVMSSTAPPPRAAKRGKSGPATASAPIRFTRTCSAACCQDPGSPSGVVPKARPALAISRQVKAAVSKARTLRGHGLRPSGQRDLRRRRRHLRPRRPAGDRPRQQVLPPPAPAAAGLALGRRAAAPAPPPARARRQRRRCGESRLARSWRQQPRQGVAHRLCDGAGVE